MMAMATSIAYLIVVVFLAVAASVVWQLFAYQRSEKMARGADGARIGATVRRA